MRGSMRSYLQKRMGISTDVRKIKEKQAFALLFPHHALTLHRISTNMIPFPARYSNMAKRIYLYILCMIVPLLAMAQGRGNNMQSVASVAQTEQTVQTKDSVIVSLITCSPGSLVYELYGHTALRVREVGQRQSDWVFNYGTFSFSQPHFMWRFMLGDTDYELGVVPYALFYDAYVREGRGIDEQVLNLTQTEANRLVDALSRNLEPENATYRYNFFYDNCTTRALRMIEQAVDGQVDWPQVKANRTLRDIVHEFSNPSPWYKFGQDLLLGAEADSPANLQQQQFAPIYAERFATDAKIRGRDGKVRPLVKTHLTLLPAQPNVEDTFPITPMAAFGILLAIALGISAWGWHKRKLYWQFDVLLLMAQGLTGCITTFLLLFSSHPTVGSNWLVVLLNPLPLVLFPWYMKAASNGRRSGVMYVEGVLGVLALVIGLVGLQQYPAEAYLIILTLLLRVVVHLHLTHKGR